MIRPGVNLVPVTRRDARLRRARVRFWAAAGVVGVGLWIAAFVGVQLVVTRDDRAVRDELDRVSAMAEDTRQEVAALRANIVREQGRLQATRAVGEQPDWSVLLALLSSVLGEEAVLRTIKIDAPPESTNASDTRASDPKPVLLELAGLGRSQQVVTRFVLRLEAMPLFARVRLLDTRREPFLASHAVGFRIECMLATDEEAAR